jgi:hypothetical protein
MVRAFAKIGRAISEDTLVNGNGGNQQPADVASRLYPQQGKA